MTNFFSRHSRLLFFASLPVIFLFSITSQLRIPRFRVYGNLFRLDRVIHIVAFFVLAVLLVLWQKKEQKKISFPKWIWLGIVGVGLAFLIEAVQIIIPLRTFNLEDVMYGIAGYILGCVFVMLPRKPKIGFLNVFVVVLALFFICIL